MTWYQALSVFLASLLSSLIIFGCGGGDGESPPPPPAQAVTLQGRVDDGLQRSPIATAACRFNLNDQNGTQVTSGNADSNGIFQLVVPLNTQGFIRCAPPALSHLVMSISLVWSA